ncbi:hypothetical protein [Tissierella creatinophila]|uniref:Vitamin B12 dependent methionine synthase, activation domain n=1 Tax=Tissierella creatinophila DSM 6911 TaxID=1123403 RepID=A0A1U7M7D8_TISCR|nr:hypothetical protein [Tissierella creatinophila]OLS03129.1 vitamin B12 dependent methionine synthase, activation domain [Tissierella creatinophila DSM 6911]
MEIRFKIKDEILRYLGYRGQTIDVVIDRMIDDTIEEIKCLIKERYVYKTFNICKEEDGFYLKETDFYLPGEDIKDHLKNSDTCILMSATLGHDVDTKIRYYEKIDMTKALIFDAAATAFIEEFCDRVCKEIEYSLKDTNKVLTSRYSPGYGDFSIGVQQEFLSVLGCQKSIGLTASSNSILIPRKSVTAILGVIEKHEKEKSRSCNDCNKYSTCAFSIGGEVCGY